MKAFNDSEKDIIRRLMQAGGDGQAVLMHELLKTFYFREEYGRALIIQNQGEYAVFFLKPELFDDREKRNGEVKRFLELIALLSYLNRKGYITVYRHTTEKMYFIQDCFDAPKVVNNQLLLTTKGYYSSSPDSICDSAKNTVYSGVIFRDDHYRFILGTVTGTLLISDTLNDLLSSTETAASEVTPEKGDSNTEVQRIVDKTKKEFTELKKTNMNNSILNPSPKRGMFKTTMFHLFFVFLAFFCIASLASSYWLYVRMENQVQNLSLLSESYRSLQNSILATNVKATELLPPAEVEKLYYGIDISRYNRDIVSEITLHDSITFIICKATEGATYTDPYFNNNWDIIRSGNYLLGVYHFYRSEDKPAHQANFFWKVVSARGATDIAPVVDVEQESLPYNVEIDTGEFQTDLLAFLENLQAKCKRSPIIYTNRPFANKYLTDNRFSDYRLWIADYTQPDAPVLPKTWEETGYTLWQKKNNHTIGSHIADFDIYFGKLSDLTK
jgi:GH25 family lysozyme M1 (1,4-beta-N-acetylmuramidase)